MQTDLNNNLQESTESKNKFPVIAVVIAVFILVILGFWYFLTKDSQNDTSIVPEPTETEFEKLKAQGSSDEIAEIEKDVNLSDFDELDKELLQIQEELSR